MKNINWQDDVDIFGRLFVFTNDPVFHQLRNVLNIDNINLNDAFSWGQLKSKRWLVTELEKLDLDFGTVFLCAGWYSTLANMLFKSSCKIDKIRSFDKDPECEAIADTINANYVKESWKFKAITDDIFNINYNKHDWQTWSKANNRMSYVITDQPNTIINTSCEHIKDFDVWYNKIPKEKILILQSNNYFDISDHVNCSDSLESFASQTPMSTELFSGELTLTKYTRFMRIGIK